MPTTSDYLTQLEQDRQDLVDNLETQGITGLTGDETFTELVPEVLNISGGGEDLGEYFITSIGNGGSTRNGVSSILKKVPNNLTISTTVANYMFSNCSNLKIAPLLDTSNVENMRNMFSGCAYLETVPLYDTSKTTNIQNIFQGCYQLSDASLDNILLMCINISSSYADSKTLIRLGFDSYYYPASRIQALPHYQDFINAGWTIGY